MRVICLGLVVAGCVAAEPDAPAERVFVEAPGCRAQEARAWIGQRPDAVPPNFVETIRVLAPGRPATMDYLPGRLNLITDSNGVISAVRCG